MTREGQGHGMVLGRLWARRDRVAAVVGGVLVFLAVASVMLPWSGAAEPPTRPVNLTRSFRNPGHGYSIDHPGAWGADIVRGGWGVIFSQAEGDRPGEEWLNPASAPQGAQGIVQTIRCADVFLEGSGEAVSPREAAFRLDVPAMYASGERELTVAGLPAVAYTHRSAGRWEELVVVCPPGWILLVHAAMPAYLRSDLMPTWEAMLASLRTTHPAESSAASLPPEVRYLVGVE